MTGTYELTFGDYFRVVRRRWVWIALCTLAGVSAAFLYTKWEKPQYRSTAKIELSREEYYEGQFVKTPTIAATAVANFSEIAKSEPVIEAAVERLKASGGLARLGLSEAEARGYARSVSVSSAGPKTSILDISLVTGDAEVSAAVADAVADALVDRGNLEVENRKDRILSYLDALVETYRRKVLEARRRIHEEEAARRQIRLDRSALPREDGVASGDLNAAYWAAVDEIERIRAEQDDLERYAAGGGDVPLGRLPTLAADPEFARAEEAYRAAESAHQALLEQYTENHPAVTAAEDRAAMALERREAVEAEAVRRARGALAAALEAAEARRDAIAARVEEANASIRRFGLEEAMRRGESEREARTLEGLLDDFLRQRDEIAIALEFSRGERLVKIDPAVPNFTPIGKKEGLIVGSGLVIGILVGFAAAFLREALDTSITTIEDVERYLQKPVLTVVPPIRIDSAKVREFLERLSPHLGDGRTPVERADLLPTAVDLRAPSAEAYRALRTNLTYNFFTKGKKVLLITSATPQEGKTTTSSNLAVALASAGRRTVLVGANVRHPNLGKFFPINRRIGINDVANGRLPLAQAIQPSGVGNLWILDSGGYISRPADILQSDLMGGILDSLRANFDAILIDTPPVLPVTDAVILAPRCDGVLLVYYVSVAPREALYRAKVQIESVGGEVIGVVLNDILSQARLEYGYYYYYHHRYAGAEERVRI